MLVMGGEYAAAERLHQRHEAKRYRGDEKSDNALWNTIRSANHDRPGARLHQVRWLAGPDSAIAAILRTQADPRFADEARFVLINNDLLHAREVPVPALLTVSGGRFLPFRPDEKLLLQPGEVRICDVEASPLRRHDPPSLVEGARRAAALPRLAIEAVTPAVDAGLFPVRRIAGEMVTVEADVICDGHEVLAVMLLWRECGAATWQEQTMQPIGNDRFRAGFPLARIGLHEFTIEAWRVEFATFRDGFAKKRMAGVATEVDCEEGRLIIARAIGAAPAGFRDTLTGLVERLRAADDAECGRMLLSEEIAALMERVDPRPFATRTDRLFAVEAERLAARFAAWYEVFPRSMSDDAARHGTFDDVIRHLPRIAGLGFDVLYFPPIHPIGRRNRKGRNNSLTPAADDPGSPYAIGADEGGHDAVHPQLGSLADFRRLIDRAAAFSLEIALDFAVQCAPDHPWVRQHRDWFDWRPDGSLKYAENPPKKYQDIVNVDFYAPGAVPGLWQELCKVVLFWAAQGVRIFRVDNPHTKPLPFWEWMIGVVKSRHPDAIFLAEAFTRPKMMYRLAKIGFTQSYSYFTWRNEKQEIIDYLTELTATPAAEFFRPNFFVNTPDINPVFLQHSGRAGFVIRAVLAATLGGLWGVYNGFELCEAAPLPGREEYLDSEKYQIRCWDWDRPGNINAEIRALNRIRRENPALQTLLGLRFLTTPNPVALCYEKALPDRSNVIIVALNLDPHHTQEWGLPDDSQIRVEELLTGTRATWAGKYQTVTLDPQMNQAAVWRVRSTR
jgi:starch synthase (maltosyl-transferring)